MDQGVCKITYDRMHECLRHFQTQFFRGPSWLKTMLTKSEWDFKEQTVHNEKSQRIRQYLDNSSLNNSQRGSVYSALRHNYSVIHGPPGTGKTTTAVDLLDSYVKIIGKTPVLVAAYSNTAVDTLLERLLEKGVNAIRIGHSARVQQNVRSATLPVQMEQHNEFYRLRDLREEVRNLSRELRFARGREKGMGHARKSKLVRELESLEHQITHEVLNSKDVICSTLVGAGCMALKRFNFPLILIDEASQAVEPSCMIAIAHAREDTQIVMLGDHKQLPPVVLSDNETMQRTLFDRFITIAEKNPSSRLKSSLLQVQYRMHPLISKWPNLQFYDGRLRDGISSADRIPPQSLNWPTSGPVLFCPCYGNEETKPHNKSKFNMTEVDHVLQIVKTLLTSLNPKDIGVITPYQAQSVILSGAVPNGVEVNTVDGFQGREKEIIIFSAVRSNSKGEVGFLKDYRRVNVAITRAKRGLIVFGNPNTLRHDPVWNSWLTFVQEHSLVLGGERLNLQPGKDESLADLSFQEAAV